MYVYTMQSCMYTVYTCTCIYQIEIKNEPLTENTATQEEESYEERGKVKGHQ